MTTTRRHHPITAIIVALAMLPALHTAGCRSASIEPRPGVQMSIAGFEPDDPLSLSYPSAVPSGWAIAEPDASPHAGDGVTLLIVIQRAGETSTFYIDIELLDQPGESYWLQVTLDDGTRLTTVPWEFLATRVRLLDGRGTVLDESIGSVAYSLLGTGPYHSFESVVIDAERRAARHARGEDPPHAAEPNRRELLHARRHAGSMLTREETIQAVRGFKSLLAFGVGMRDDRMMRRLVHPLVTIRQTLVLVAARFHTTFSIDDGSIVRAEAALPNGFRSPAARGGMIMRFGSTPVFRADALCIEPIPPFGLCGGIVRIDARNIGQPGTRVIMQPVATRRGDRPPRLLTADGTMEGRLGHDGQWLMAPADGPDAGNPPAPTEPAR